MRLLLAIPLAALASEAAAWWWTHPAPAGQHDPVLVWEAGGRWTEAGISETGGRKPEDGSDSTRESSQRPSFDSSLKTENLTLDTSVHSSFNIPHFTLTPRPDLVAKFVPQLHCSKGDICMLETSSGLVIHMAMFAWDSESAGSHVLEAFKHDPQECLGIAGMTFKAILPPVDYPLNSATITFQGVEFIDPTGANVYAFKGIWISGSNQLPKMDHQLGFKAAQRLARWQAARTRLRPAHARVVEGAVRGATNADQAWQALEDSMLHDLKIR